MKKVFKVLVMVLLGLFAGVNTTWGQGSGDIGGMLSGVDNPAGWFYVRLNANVSTPACGTNPGEVRLTCSDISNNPNAVNPWITGEKTANPYGEDPESSDYSQWNTGWNDGVSVAKKGFERGSYPSNYYVDSDPGYGLIEGDKRPEGHDAGWDWYQVGEFLNDENPTVWGVSASLRGYSIIYAEGIEVPNYGVSTYAYFLGEAQENDGWYFAGWSYTEGDYDLGGTVDEPTLFKVLPSSTAGIDHLITKNIYATFKPVMVANYTVSGTIDVTPGVGNSGSNTIVFDVQGERLSAADFTVTAIDAETDDDEYAGHGTCVPTITSVVDGKVTVTVTYTTTDAATGTYRCNITLASKSGCSKLKAPIFARVAEVSEEQASLYNNKVAPENLVTSGDLTTLIATATDEQIVALNKNYTDALSIGKDVTIDLNGYTLSNALTITSGNVTLAYSKYWGNITKTVTINNGATLTLNGGIIAVENEVAVDVKAGGTLIQNGATIRINANADNAAVGIVVGGTATLNDGTINAQATNGDATAVKVGATGDLTTNGGTISASSDENAYAVQVTNAAGKADINGGSFSATSTVNKAVALSTVGKMTVGKKAIVSAHIGSSSTTAYAIETFAGADVTVNGGRYDATHIESETAISHAPIAAEAYGAFTFNAGYVKSDHVYISGGNEEPKLYNLTYKGKDYNEGYRYLAVREDLDAKEYGMQAVRIGTTGYSSLAEALAYANNNRDEDVVIVLQNDEILPAGYYTLPAKATLIIPREYEQEAGSLVIPRVSSTNSNPTAYVQPYPYVTLTIAAGANIDVHGTIEVSGMQRATDGSYAAHPHGPCGFVNMQEGSNMTMQSGSELRAWGFIIGQGETDVRRGAIVREQFQMGDWKGGSTSFAMLSDTERRVFPLTHYYIQNIESPFKYHPGAILSTTTAVSATWGGLTVTASANDIKVVGVSGRDQAMFLMDNEADADNTWVRKWYDVENDLQVYDVNNSAHIGSMVLDLGKLGTTPLEMNSGFFVLPITCNMKIHLLSGTMDFTQNTALLPGAEVEIDKESFVTIVHNMDPSVLSGSLYIYDANQWDKYAYDESVNGGIKYTKSVQYAAGFGGKPTARADQYYDKTKLKDATINVHGSFAINYEDCYLYTSAGGANIFSTNEDAGTYVFNVAGPTEETTAMVWQVKNRSDYNAGDAFTAAQLKNKEGHEPAFTQTTNFASNTSLCYMDDEWRNRMYFDCYAADMDMDEYMEEVQKKIQNDLYGEPTEYDLGMAVKHLYIKPQEWVEIAGTAEIEFSIQEDTEEAFAGWQSDVENEEKRALFEELLDRDAHLPYVVAVDGNIDHTYSDAAGAGRLFIMTTTATGDCDQWWEVEQKDNLYHCIHPLNDTYYSCDYDEDLGMYIWKEKKFTITWKNWNGDIIKTTDKDGNPVDSYDVTYGTMAEFLGTNPTREATIDYTYDFTGWTPALGPVTQDVTYTATFTQKPRMYTIIFQQEGGVEIERHFLTHNEMPVCENVPTKVGHTLEWTPAIKAVTGDQTYVATWHEDPPTEYEITFYDYDGTTILQHGNVNVGDMPVYSEATPAGKPASASGEYTYVFDHWAPDLEEVSATSVKSYTAIYREVPVQYTVVFLKEGGDPNAYEESDIIERHQYQYGETPVCSELPIKAATPQYTYTLRWEPQIQTVMEDAVYTAVFDATINKYTVNVKSNPSGACVIYGNGLYDYNDDEEAVEIAVTPNEGYTFTGWGDAVLDDATFEDGGDYVILLPVTSDINLVANFTYDGEDTKYTITWKNEAGTANLMDPVTQLENTVTIYTGAIPTKDASAQYVYTFDGWTTSPNGDGIFYKNNLTPKATEDATYYAHFAATAIPDLVAPANGAPVVITEAATYRDLVLSSDGLQSSQLIGADQLTITGDAYFDLTLNAAPATWYAIAVPWQVNINGGISVNGDVQTINSDFYLLTYNSAERAAHGPSSACWTFLSGGTMQPGTLYMIYMVNGAATIRFTKKAGAPILTDKLNVYAHESGTGRETDAGWNGIANPALYYAYLNAEAETYGKVNFGQKYIPGDDRYEAIDMKNNKLIVAQPVFVQVADDKSNVAAQTGNSGFLAPVRKAKVDNSYYEVQISNGERYSDRLYIQTMENKEERYKIGYDLSKAGTSTKVAQMWVNRYDTKLCVNTTASVGTSAMYPLGIQVPKDGEYQIYSVTEMQSGQELYVTLNGHAIWNLAFGPYTASLTKGTHNQYGLKLVQKAPAITTGVETISDERLEKNGVRKVLIDNTIYIIRDGAVYTINGQQVK